MKASVIYWYSKSEMRRDGGGLRALAWEDALSSLGYQVEIVPLWTVGAPSSATGRLSRLKKTAIPLPFSRKIPDEVLGSDLVVATALAVFEDALRRLPADSLVLDWMDLWSTWATSVGGAHVATRLGGGVQSALWRRRERDFSGRAARNTYAGFDDFRQLSRRGARGAAWVPTPAEYVGTSVPGPRDRVGFLGNLDYLPNQLSLRTFLERFSRRLTEIGTTVVVAGFGSEVVASWPFPVEVMGAVDDLQDFYSQVGSVVVPIEHGSGIKVKAVEAMSYGLPVLATPHVRDGFSDDFTPYLHDLESLFTNEDLAVVPRDLFEERFSMEAFRTSVAEVVRPRKQP